MNTYPALQFGTKEDKQGRNTGLAHFVGGNEAAVVIASPGSGKSQAIAIPNLLTWSGPAFILDIKGELYDATAKHRASFGKVYRFNPEEPFGHAFNPFAFVDPNNRWSFWRDCQFLVELMVIPSDQGDPFWQNSGRDLLVAIVAGLYLDNSTDEPINFEQILDALTIRAKLSRLVAGLESSSIRAAQRAAQYIKELIFQEAENQSKMLQSFCLQALSYLGRLTGDHIVHATRQCDWWPEELRRDNATVYIDLRSSDIEDYKPLIRMMLGINYRALTKALPEEGDAPILFLLDEMPQLGYMRAIEQLLDIGRGYGLKLLMFAQQKGQIKKAYGDAEGFLAKCAVRAYMNPAGADADNLAQVLSDALGKKTSIKSDQQKPVVEPYELAGPDYQDRVIVLQKGQKPARLYKAFIDEQSPLHQYLCS